MHTKRSRHFIAINVYMMFCMYKMKHDKMKQMSRELLKLFNKLY